MTLQQRIKNSAFNLHYVGFLNYTVFLCIFIYLCTSRITLQKNISLVTPKHRKETNKKYLRRKHFTQFIIFDVIYSNRD